MTRRSTERKAQRTYDAHETARMAELHGAPLAPFSRRALAFATDFLIAWGIFLALLITIGRLAVRYGFVNEDINLKFDFQHWYSLLILVLYFALTTYWGKGWTPGKWLCGIRVVSLVRERLSFWDSLERGLGYGASVLEFGFGFVQFFIHPNRRTVHDRIAETIVIRDSRTGRRAIERAGR
jgi:uncharacterized RDD family membrane protein YckC